jgi:hypothetical protein
MTGRHGRVSASSHRLRAESGGTPRGQVFRREGEYWTIVYDGTLFRLKDGKGLRYLAHLLSHPDERIHCAELCSATGVSADAAAAIPERTRVAVTKRIKASVAKIATQHPGLAQHLSSRIQTGYFCVYLGNPGGPISWKV